MEKIYSYEGIPKSEIVAKRLTADGKAYSIDHSKDLVISMRYQGDNGITSNSQGWDRNNVYYFKVLKQNHPEYFDSKNSERIDNGLSPRVNSQFVRNFPQYKGYENEVLIHHHIGKNGQAVAVPSSIHKGSGEIHSVEDSLGITKNAKEFSDNCKKLSQKDKSLFGKTSSELKEIEVRKQQINLGLKK